MPDADHPRPDAALERIAAALERIAQIEEDREDRRRAPRPRARVLPEPTIETSRAAAALLRRKGLL